MMNNRGKQTRTRILAGTIGRADGRQAGIGGLLRRYVLAVLLAGMAAGSLSSCSYIKKCAVGDEEETTQRYQGAETPLLAGNAHYTTGPDGQPQTTAATTVNGGDIWEQWSYRQKLRWMRRYKRSSEALYLSSMLKDRIVAQFPNPDGVDPNAWGELVHYSRIHDADSGYFFNSGHILATNTTGESVRHYWSVLYQVTPGKKKVINIEIRPL